MIGQEKSDRPRITRRGLLHASAGAAALATAAWTSADASELARKADLAQPEETASPPPRRGRLQEWPANLYAVPGEDGFIDKLLARMTVEEKVGQLTQILGSMADGEPSLPPLSEEKIRAGLAGSFLSVYGTAFTRRLQQIAVEQSRLRIPLLFAFDVIHGFRTVFPVPIGESASFDTEAVEGAARVSATEAAAYGLHWTFAPMVDIARDPRWGRTVEGAGEDPYLGSRMAAARVRGFQGHDLAAADTMMATAKHFVAYGAAEGGRDYNVADLSRRTLNEIYLPPFKAAVGAGAQCMMVAFNELSGIPMHANRTLVRGLLRDEWKFDGVIVSDYAGIPELIAHGVAGDNKTAAALAFHASIDVDMDGGVYIDELPKAVQRGELSNADLDDAVRRVLRAKIRLGLFSDPYRYCDAEREGTYTLRREYREAARSLARKSFVLLKNDNEVLPLAKDLGTVAVIGPLADNARAMLGSWIGAGRPEDVITPLAGIRAALGPTTRVTHTAGTSIDGTDTAEFESAERLAREADAVLLFLGEDGDMTGEARSRSSLTLPGKQEALTRTVQAVAVDKPLVVVICSGRPLSIEWIAERLSSLLVAWFPGVEAGNAIADILFGDCSPAGRLPVTFPRNIGQVPIYYNHKPTGRPAQLDKTNTSKYMDVPPGPLFPFGHGLSYTRFAYSDLKLSAKGIRAADGLRVTVTVSNVGARASDEVVQLYLRDDIASVTRPVMQLRRFERLHLKAGEWRRVSFDLEPDDFVFYGLDETPTIEPGSFTVFVGGSSADTIDAKFEIVR